MYSALKSNHMIIISAETWSMVYTYNGNKHTRNTGKTTLPPFTVPLALEARFIHFVISSSILSALAGFNPQRHPLREPPFTVGFSIFSKHLFSDKLCRMEFYNKIHWVTLSSAETNIFSPGFSPGVSNLFVHRAEWRISKEVTGRITSTS